MGVIGDLVHAITPFFDLAALSAVIGTVLCLLWTAWPKGEGAPPNPCFDRCRNLLLICLIALSISSAGDLLRRAMEMSGLGITEVLPVLPIVVFKSHYGSMWLIRMAGLVTAWIIWWARKRHLDSRSVAVSMFCAAAAIAFARSASGHASDFGDLSLQQLSDWFHLLAAACWGGAILAIAGTLPPSIVVNNNEQQRNVSGIADKFYVFFGPVFAVLMASGLYNAWVEVGTPSGLWSTAYGRFLSVKLVLGALLALRYIVPPQHGKDDAVFSMKFLRRMRVEAFLVLGILLCVALFIHEIPARHALHVMPDHEHRMEPGQRMEPGHNMMPGHNM